jgi:hypothetical protein
MTDKIHSAVFELSDRISLQGLGQGEGGVLLKLDSGELYTLNDTAFDFLSSLDGKNTVLGAAEKIAQKYSIDIDTVLSDLTELVGDLEPENLIKAR